MRVYYLSLQGSSNAPDPARLRAGGTPEQIDALDSPPSPLK